MAICIRNAKIFSNFRFKKHEIEKVFSTVTATETVETKNLRATEPIDKLSLKNETQWYTVPKEVVEKLTLHEAVPAEFLKQTVTFNEFSFMIRRPALDLANCLSHVIPDRPIVRYIMYGRYGNGKSLTLLHLLCWALAQKWIICHFPRTFKYRRSYKTSIQSTWKTSRLDLPEESTLWLQTFLKTNEHLLNNPELVATAEYKWTADQTTKKDEPLLNIVNQGISHMKSSSDCVAVLLKELKHYAKLKKIKLLVAVDQVNTLFGPTLLRRADNYYAEPDDVTIIKALRDMIKFDWNNGAFVGIADPTEKVLTTWEFTKPQLNFDYLPYFLFGHDGFDYLDPFVPVEVPFYTVDEANSAVDFYIHKRWLINPQSHTPQAKTEMFHMSFFNPLLLNQICSRY